jgi:ribosomal protein S18 acetylase RimI-like enzyme
VWRLAKNSDDDAIREMCLALYAEDPSPMPVTEGNIRATLATLREEPSRGQAVVLEVEGVIGGFALLISFWSNELGGELIVIDELYVTPSFRNRGHARELLTILAKENHLWPGRAVALELEVTPGNRRAASLYEKAGFTRVKNARLRLLVQG